MFLWCWNIVKNAEVNRVSCNIHGDSVYAVYWSISYLLLWLHNTHAIINYFMWCRKYFYKYTSNFAGTSLKYALAFFLGGKKNPSSKTGKFKAEQHLLFSKKTSS